MPFIGPLEDRISIREFQESFADVINRKARDVWLEFWTDDAVWVTGGLTAKGKEEILNQWDKFYSPFNTTRNNETRFYKAMPAALTIDDDKALGRSYIEVLILYAGTVEPEELFSSIMFFHKSVTSHCFDEIIFESPVKGKRPASFYTCRSKVTNAATTPLGKNGVPVF